jgi:hypothetical protein
MSESKFYKRQLDIQTDARENLERRTLDLERQLALEREKSRAVEDLKRSKRQWQEKTGKLVVSLQKECNAIFDRQIKDPIELLSPGPAHLEKENINVLKTIKGDSSSFANASIDGRLRSAQRSRSSAKSKQANAMSFQPEHDLFLQSPMQLNKTLDETEALVQSLLGDEFQHY